MRMLSRKALLAALALVALPAGVYAANIVETAQTDGHFTMLLAAGKTAGAAGWLQSPGPITVFAPDDAAFAKLPQAMRDDLMKPANRTMLKMTVGNHAVAGLVTMADIDKGLAMAPAVAVPAMHSLFGIAGASRVVGVYEILTGLLIAARPMMPKLGAIGGAMATILFLVTLSFMLTTPGVVQAGFDTPFALSAMPGQFLFKDLGLLAASFWVLLSARQEARLR